MPLSKEGRKPIQRLVSPTLDDMANDFERLHHNNSIVKDGTEIELEKLVFGDDAGFHERLKSYKNGNTDLQGLLDGPERQARSSLERGNLENLDDADVCKFEMPVGLAFAQRSSSCSSSTPLRRW